MVYRTMILMFFGICWQPVLIKADDAPSGSAPAAASEEFPGHISGLVTSAETGTPVSGAYVGIGDFGDAGGTNLARFDRQGLYAHTETDADGRFELRRIALHDHPLVVTHPDFVRHDETVMLSRDNPEAEVNVRLESAAKVLITVVDEEGKRLNEPLTICLESLDGHCFIPPEMNRHLSAFASRTWRARVRDGVYQFTSLPEGQYAFDAIRMTSRQGVTYHGGIDRLRVNKGESKEARIDPVRNDTTVTVRVTSVPVKADHIPWFLAVNRNTALLLWDDALMHSLEDQRLGRITMNALIMTLCPKHRDFTVDNLPPGTYAFFMGPAVSPDGAKVEIERGDRKDVTIQWTMPTGPARVRLWTLDRSLSLPEDDYTAARLCQLLTERARPVPEIRVVDAVRRETIHLPQKQMSLWDVLEAIYVQKGWVVRERGDKTLIVGPESQIAPNVSDEIGQEQQE